VTTGGQPGPGDKVVQERARERVAQASQEAPGPASVPASPPAGERFVPLQPARLPELMALERRIYPFPWTSGNFEDALRSGYSAWTLEGASGQIVAYAVAMLAVDEAHLLNLAVDPMRQQRGYGWRMLEWMAATMHEYGARSLILEVRPSNLEAQRLYRRYGFEQIGVRRGYYPARWGREDALVMRVALPVGGDGRR
jgi:ribosomal-protein-alanine N-acetyltransferase